MPAPTTQSRLRDLEIRMLPYGGVGSSTQDRYGQWPRLRIFGNVEVGNHVLREQVVERYDSVI